MLPLFCNVVFIPSQSLNIAFDANSVVNFVDALCFLEALVVAISHGLCW